MSENWHVIPGSIAAPLGFRAAGVAAGLKPSGDLDLALIVSDDEAIAAGVFTTNQVRAACVTYGQAQLAANPRARAILCNAGQANACTGADGDRDNQAVADLTASALGIDADLILTASTGVIGQRFEVDKFASAMPDLVELARSLDREQGADLASKAILTTDLAPKSIAIETDIDGHPIRLGGIAKGSGMIHPNMATMLAFVTCDARIASNLWQTMTRRAANVSFNQITVDGDTSTNDMLLALANGRSSAPEIAANTPQAEQLQAALDEVCIHLAKAIAQDGEGATKLLEIRVAGAATPTDARHIARVVACSPLVKTAAYGCDPNWGRIAMAVGKAGVVFDQTKLDIALGDFVLMQAGTPLDFDRATAALYMKEHDTLTISVDLHRGTASGLAWGCDLSYDYVRINAEYTT
ncbi:MAG: bifunctional glutamate N-acetyltransferase/amino-acid acetyltransferase ArgJ [Cyanobacteria bacterium J06642_2]